MLPNRAGAAKNTLETLERSGPNAGSNPTSVRLFSSSEGNVHDSAFSEQKLGEQCLVARKLLSSAPKTQSLSSDAAWARHHRRF
jgi:hypothetical protein